MKTILTFTTNLSVDLELRLTPALPGFKVFFIDFLTFYKIEFATSHRHKVGY